MTTHHLVATAAVFRGRARSLRIGQRAEHDLLAAKAIAEEAGRQHHFRAAARPLGG
jgi:hypothetical protein